MHQGSPQVGVSCLRIDRLALDGSSGAPFGELVACPLKMQGPDMDANWLQMAPLAHSFVPELSAARAHSWTRMKFGCPPPEEAGWFEPLPLCSTWDAT